MKNYPKLEALRRRLQHLGDAADAMAGLQHELQEIANSDVTQRYFLDFSRENSRRPGFISSVGNSLPIFTESGFAVSLGIECDARPRPQEVASVPQDLALVLLGDGVVNIEIHREANGPAACFESGSRVELHRVLRLTHAQPLFLDGRRDHVLMYSSQPYVTLVVTRERLLRHLSERHDADDGRALYATAASQGLTRLQHVCKYLAHFGDSRVQSRLSELVGHPAHFVRWGAAEALLNVDFDEGLRALDRLRADAHPHIASAAALAWGQLQHREAACH